MTPKFKVGDRVERKKYRWKGTVMDMYSEEGDGGRIVENIMVLWDDDAHAGFVGREDYDFCIARYLRLAEPPKREELHECTDYDA